MRGLIPRNRTLPVKERILEELTRLRLRENGKWQTKKLESVSLFQVATKIGQLLRHHPAFDEVIPGDLIRALNVLGGCELSAGQAHPQILVTPPQKAAWSIPEVGWHVDVATRDVIPGIQVFVLLDDVAPHGGGTVAIQGSHRARDLAPTAERVLEMSGKAGDVYLMDMRVVHAPSINATKNARMMLTARYLNGKARS
ncbi:phytanoyl-CoA dioxygenase family protein [Oligoflexus tunisiensis]|uniref:phytanoyl-CoA dioxygenase family protein n=1 Tax=Oligoflexus tunisiensis TaxID=708132 RepID=UPI001C4079B0|nr:phytanoyl-CoA dioxygenase family protein [Oligoflexus tunisiensis]